MGTKRLISAWEIIVVIILFLVIGYLTQKNINLFEQWIGNSVFGMIAYVILLAIAVIIAPLNATPFVPIASLLWGWLAAGSLSVAGWSIGSLVAFLIARRYGVHLLTRFVSLDKIKRYEKLIPEGNFFWGIVFLRITVPTDILSYMLGLFSDIKVRTYFLATVIGLAPFAFAVAYIGELSLFYQLLALSTGLLLLLLGILGGLIKKKKSEKEQ